MTAVIDSDESKNTIVSRRELTDAVIAEAQRIGFDLVGVAPAVTPTSFGNLTEWLRQGFAGEMQYMPRREAAYEHPSSVLPNVRSVIMLALNYNSSPPGHSSGTDARSETDGRVARYAQGSVDYHDLLRGKLKQLADAIHHWRPGCRTRGIVDTAPLLERDFARAAGIGWFGKNTMLINKRVGSWIFLAALLTDLDLEPDAPHQTSHCGTCTRCLDVCPTDAFVGPYVLDARKCISYLTIELRNSIPVELRDGIGDWIFGCDLCQDVCPWNRKAPATSETALQPLPDLAPSDALQILRMSQTEFSTRFERTPLSRPGWEGLRRNAAIVLGNSGQPDLIASLQEFENDPSEPVREAVYWAVHKLRELHTIGDGSKP